MANDLTVKNEDFDDDVAEIKRELLPVLENDELWKRLTQIVIKRPERLRDYFWRDEFASFIMLVVTVGMLRNELIKWCGQHDH